MSLSNEQVLAFLRKNPISVSCTVLALAVAAGIYYRADDVGAAQTALETNAQQGERLATNIKYSAQLQEQVDSIAAANAKIDSRLVRPSQLAINWQYFYRIEADTDTKLLDINQLPVPATKGKPNFISVGYTLGVQGSYVQVLDFLRRVENGAHFCRVLNATLSPAAGDSSDRVTLRLNLELLGAP